MLAAYVTVAGSFVGGGGTLAFGRDAAGCRLLPREVRNRRTGMVIRIGNVDEVVRVNANLEEVGKAPVGAAQQATG